MPTDRLNAVWHRSHRMPANPTLDQRVQWHRAHSRVCSCREMPDSIKLEIQRRTRTASTRRRRTV